MIYSSDQAGPLMSALGSLGQGVGQAVGEANKRRRIRSSQSLLQDVLQGLPPEATIGDYQNAYAEYVAGGGEPSLFNSWVKNRTELLKTAPKDKSVFQQWVESSSRDAGGPLNQIFGVIDTDARLSDTRTLRAPDPASGNTPLSKMTDDWVMKMVASDDPDDRRMGKAEMDLRKQNRDNFNADRKHATELAKPFMQRMETMREGHLNSKYSLDRIADAIGSRDQATKTKDWWANMFGKWGEPFLSPQGAVVQSEVKNYLIDDLSQVKGRPNQFLENQILQSLPGLGKTDEANEAVLIGFQRRADVMEAWLDIYDKRVAEYKESVGYVPDNIGAIVAEQMRPVVEDIDSKYAYKMQEVREKQLGIEKAERQKVTSGTPLTFEMMTYMSDKYGPDKAKKRAEQLGYTILPKQKYERYRAS